MKGFVLVYRLGQLAPIIWGLWRGKQHKFDIMSTKIEQKQLIITKS